MENLKGKIEAKREQVEEAEKQYKDAKRNRSAWVFMLWSWSNILYSIVHCFRCKIDCFCFCSATDKKKKAVERLKEQLNKLEIQETDREENKTIALGTSKLNYLDPRISVAWYVWAVSFLHFLPFLPFFLRFDCFEFCISFRCKKNDVPIEKVYNKTQRDKFRWAIDMAGPEYVF